MALSHIQTTAKHTADASSSLSITFATLPTVGNGLIVCINKWGGFEAALTCTDNQGGSNTYSSVAVKTNISGNNEARLFLCPAVAASSGTFTITITAASGGPYWVGAAIEVGGLSGGSLTTDQTVTASGNSATPATGTTAALTKTEVFVVAQHAVSIAQASITVESVSPAWTQAFEELPFARIAGEANHRILTSASGTTTSGSWTNASSGQWSAVLAAFGTTAVTTEARLSQLPVEVLVLSDAPITVQLSQLAVEVLSNDVAEPATAVRVSQLPVEILLESEVVRAEEVRATQLAAELASQQDGAARVSQVALDLAWAAPSDLRVTQLLIEVARPRVEPAGLTGEGGTPGIAWIEWRGRASEVEALRGRSRPGPRSAMPRVDTLETVALSDWDLQDPPAYYHGYKSARVESFGNATRTLSDPRTGDWHGSACDIRLADPDRALRTAVANSPQRFGADALVTVRMVSRPVRAALGEPLTVFAGPIRRADPSPTLSFTLLLEDAVGHGMLTDTLLIPQRLVEAVSLPTTLVLDPNAIGHPVPIIYGTHARDTGAVAPVYLGIENGTQHLWLVAGHYAAVTNIFLEGISVLGTEGSEWTLPGLSGPLVEDYNGRRYTLLRGRVGTPSSVTDPVLYAENAGTVDGYFEAWVTGMVGEVGVHWDANATTGARSGARCLHGVDLREGDFAVGHFGRTGPPGTAVPRGYEVNTYTSLKLYLKNETVGWGDAILKIRFTIFSSYEETGVVITLADGVYGLDAFDTSAYQEIEIPVEDFEIPDDTRPDRLWIVKWGDDDISVLVDDISLTGGAAAEGEVTPADRAAGGAAFALNVTGWTTTGDETGSVISDLYAQYQHFLINYVATPAGYLTGGPLANPTTDLYDRIVEVIDESSFTTASAQAVTRYPPDGYQGAGVLGATASDRLSVRDWIARWNLSADCRFGVSRYGELFIVLTDPTVADRDAATLVEEVNDILEGSFSIEMGWEVQATRVPYRADYHWAAGTWLAVKRDANDPGLAETYGRDIESPVKDYWFVPTAAQAKDVAEHEVERVGNPPRVLEFETGLQLATAGLGGYLRVRHFAGVGPSETRLVQIEELMVAPGTRRVRIRAVDVDGLIATAEELAARSARIGIGRLGLMRLGYPGYVPEEG